MNDEPNVRASPAQVPAVTFTIGLEAPLKFEIRARPGGDIDRLGDWVRAHEDLARVFRAAYDAVDRAA